MEAETEPLNVAHEVDALEKNLAALDRVLEGVAEKLATYMPAPMSASIEQPSGPPHANASPIVASLQGLNQRYAQRTAILEEIIQTAQL